MTDPIDEKISPICGKDNNCMAHSSEPCWCLVIKIPQELLDLVQESKKQGACICLKCIHDYKKIRKNLKRGKE